MYDNVELSVTKDHVKELDFLHSVPDYLTSISGRGVSQYGEYVNGYLDSLKVSITTNRVKIHQSSLCKYYLGDNFKTLTRGDTKRAIEKISDCLHLPFNLANVTRIDFAENIITKYSEKIYFPFLGEAQYYNRLEQNNGLYYNLLTGKRQLLFYGKEYEQKAKGQPIPELYQNRNILRYEFRLLKHLGQQLNLPLINGGLLYNDSFFNSMVERWKNEYLSIQKINSKLNNMKPTGSKKEFIENLALFTILELGQPNVLSRVKQWQKQGEISKKQAYDLRATVKEIGKVKKNEVDNELINELDKKIKEVARSMN